MLRIYNSLSRKVEDFMPLSAAHVGMYTCGPTVYDYATIGNFRTYIMSDVLHRALLYNGYTVTFVMNITDVGHLTGDNLGDADTGEDRMEKAAKKQGKNAWDVAAYYTDAFLKDYRRLNIREPKLFAKATDHIPEQIALVQRLEEKGFAYTITDGVYFDTAKFPPYGQLSNLDEIKEGARVEANKEKRNPRDFALWKFSRSLEQRQMEWDSPWGKGFPGWHIECSAMSMKYLGEQFDIHTGGIDLRSTHHPNEIAQAEAATGKQFVKYWVHGAFILVDGKRMSKSLGNNYTVEDIRKNGFDPLALRYLYLQTHYRQEMNFTWQSLEAAHNALVHLREAVSSLKEGAGDIDEAFNTQFTTAMNNDLTMPDALATMWELLKAKRSDATKLATILRWDTVLGLNAAAYRTEEVQIPDAIRLLVEERTALRKEGKYSQADALRGTLQEKGYEILDEDGQTIIRKIH